MKSPKHLVELRASSDQVKGTGEELEAHTHLGNIVNTKDLSSRKGFWCRRSELRGKA